MALNIILLIAGAIVFIVSFIMPEMGSELEQVDPQLTRKQIRDMIDKEMGTVKDQVSEIVEAIAPTPLRSEGRKIFVALPSATSFRAS